ncbi:MAG: adenosylmethionine decarboxylase [Candidatus Zixiibacteriota bacterium]|nr:MAG: adenosylmethionine decarboxylase [candidate division Zixibacteria bacterium]
MKILGRHLLAEYAQCNPEPLSNRLFLERIMKGAVRFSGATMVDSVFHQYNPQGLSGVIVIAESHISIHTWPEYDYASVDCFTCGTNVDPWKVVDYLKEALGSKILQVKELPRGIPSEKDEIIAHKPADSPIAAPVK